MKGHLITAKASGTIHVLMSVSMRMKALHINSLTAKPYKNEELLCPQTVIVLYR